MPNIPPWVFFLAFLFVLFLIYTDPSNAAVVAGGFGDFVVTLFEGLGDFLNGLFDGDSATGSNRSGVESAPNKAPTPTSIVDSYSHTHDGIPAHTHPPANG